MTPPTLKLEGGWRVESCPTCRGEGKVKSPRTYTRSGQWAQGDGRPIPCPECKGKKVVYR